MTTARECLENIQQRMAAAAQRAGRAAAEVRLIAVSKTQPAAAIQALIDLGIRDFGESQMQEAQEKIEHFRNAELNWHFIGHLQSNKTRYIPGNFHWVHAVDSVRLARRISEAAVARGQSVKLLLQVNVAQDPSKHGLLPADQPLFSHFNRYANGSLGGAFAVAGLQNPEPAFFDRKFDVLHVPIVCFKLFDGLLELGINDRHIVF